MADFNSKISLDANQFNSALDQILSKMGVLSKDINNISKTKVTDSPLNPLKKDLDDISLKAGGFGSKLKGAFSEAGSGIKSALGSGSLTGALDGVGGSLLSLAGKAGPYGMAIAAGVGAIGTAVTALYNKGAEMDEIADSLELMFTGKGLNSDQIKQNVDDIIQRTFDLSYSLDMPREKMTELFKVAIASGKSGDAAEVFVKQGLAVEKMTGGIVSAQEMMKLLNRGMADPENEKAFARLTGKAPELAKGLKEAGTEQERLAFLTKVTGQTLEVMAKQAKDPETAMTRITKVWDQLFATAGSEAFDLGNTLLAPFGDFADWVQANMPAIKEIITDVMDGVSLAFEITTGITKALWEVISALAKIIIDYLVFAFNTWSNIISSVVDYISNLLNLSSSGPGIFQKLGQSVSDAGGVMNFLRGTIAGLTSAFSTFIDIVSETWDKLKSFDLKGAFDTWANAGARIGESFNKGYNEKTEELKIKQVKDAEETEEKKTKVTKKGIDDRDKQEKKAIADSKMEILKLEKEQKEAVNKSAAYKKKLEEEIAAKKQEVRQKELDQQLKDNQALIDDNLKIVNRTIGSNSALELLYKKQRKLKLESMGFTVSDAGDISLGDIEARAKELTAIETKVANEAFNNQKTQTLEELAAIEKYNEDSYKRIFANLKKQVDETGSFTVPLEIGPPPPENLAKIAKSLGETLSGATKDIDFATIGNKFGENLGSAITLRDDTKKDLQKQLEEALKSDAPVEEIQKIRDALGSLKSDSQLFTENFANSMDGMSKSFFDNAEKIKKDGGDINEAYASLAVGVASAFAGMVDGVKMSSGEMVSTFINALIQMLPAFISMIMGKSISEQGWIGIATGAALVAIMLGQMAFMEEGGLLGTGSTGLKSGLTKKGAKLLAINENGSPEYIVNARSTAKYKDLLDAINKDNVGNISYQDNFKFSQSANNSDVVSELKGVNSRLEKLEKAQMSIYNRQAFEIQMSPLEVSGDSLYSVYKNKKRKAVRGL